MKNLKMHAVYKNSYGSLILEMYPIPAVVMVIITNPKIMQFLLPIQVLISPLNGAKMI